MSDTAILLECCGNVFSGWESVSFSHSLDELSRSFYMEINDETGGFASGIKEESECVLSAVDRRYSANQFGLESLIPQRTELFKGIVFDTDTTIEPGGYGYSISGNDRTIDLVECSVIVPSNTWKKAKVSRIIKDICQPFGINVYASGMANDTEIENFSVNSGDTAFAPIERLCRFSGVIPFSDTDGHLNLITVDDISERASVPLVVGKNVIRVSRSTSIRDRRSSVTGKALTSGNGKKWSDKNLKIKAQSFDDGVTRYRPLVIVAESKEDKASLQQRVNWESQIRAGRANEYTVEVADIFQRDKGEPVGLWTVGTLVDLIVDKWDLSQEFLISAVDFSMGNAGRRSILTLRNKNTYKADPADKVSI